MRKCYKSGYADGIKEGKRQAVEQILKFVEEESKFILHNTEDMLLDRLVKEIKKIEGEVKWYIGLFY